MKVFHQVCTETYLTSMYCNACDLTVLWSPILILIMEVKCSSGSRVHISQRKSLFGLNMALEVSSFTSPCSLLKRQIESHLWRFFSTPISLQTECFYFQPKTFPPVNAWTQAFWLSCLHLTAPVFNTWRDRLCWNHRLLCLMSFLSSVQLERSAFPYNRVNGDQSYSSYDFKSRLFL